jgi:hypothetical protein
MDFGVIAATSAIACAAQSSLLPRCFAFPVDCLSTATGRIGAPIGTIGRLQY